MHVVLGFSIQMWIFEDDFMTIFVTKHNQISILRFTTTTLFNIKHNPLYENINIFVAQNYYAIIQICLMVFQMFKTNVNVMNIFVCILYTYKQHSRIIVNRVAILKFLYIVI